MKQEDIWMIKVFNYVKCLINSGTLDPIAQYDLVIPHLTSCLHDIPEKQKKEFELCTVRLFPSQIDHCVQWTKNYFIDWICQGISNIKDLLNNSINYIEEITNYDGSITDLKQKYSIIEFYLDIFINHNFEYFC